MRPILFSFKTLHVSHLTSNKGSSRNQLVIGYEQSDFAIVSQVCWSFLVQLHQLLAHSCLCPSSWANYFWLGIGTTICSTAHHNIGASTHLGCWQTWKTFAPIVRLISNSSLNLFLKTFRLIVFYPKNASSHFDLPIVL